MGNGQSRTNMQYLKSVGAPPMLPSKKDKYAEYRTTEAVQPRTIGQPRTLRTPFSATWSVCTGSPGELAPPARSQQVSIYDDVSNCMIIAYGIDSLGSYLNDVWQLNLMTYTWTKIEIALPAPRTGASCAKLGRELVIFGGKDCSGRYLAELHAVNLDTGAVRVLSCTEEPPGRENAGIFYNEKNIYIWSGYNGQILADFWVYSIERGDWVEQRNILDIAGRQAASYVQSRLDPNTHYIFGSTTGHPLAKFDSSTETFETLRCSGTAPPPELKKAMVCVCDEYLFVIGGEKDSQFTYVYALDLLKLQWFPFFVQPDKITTIFEDGNWSKVGIFQLPRQHSGALVYCPVTRSLVSVMGSLHHDPPPTNILSVGTALSVLHLNSDMLNMLNI